MAIQNNKNKRTSSKRLAAKGVSASRPRGRFRVLRKPAFAGLRDEVATKSTPQCPEKTPASPCEDSLTPVAQDCDFRSATTTPTTSDLNDFNSLKKASEAKAALDRIMSGQSSPVHMTSVCSDAEDLDLELACPSDEEEFLCSDNEDFDMELTQEAPTMRRLSFD